MCSRIFRRQAAEKSRSQLKWLWHFFLLFHNSWEALTEATNPLAGLMSSHMTHMAVAREKKQTFSFLFLFFLQAHKTTDTHI